MGNQMNTYQNMDTTNHTPVPKKTSSPLRFIIPGIVVLCLAAIGVLLAFQFLGTHSADQKESMTLSEAITAQAQNVVSQAPAKPKVQEQQTDSSKTDDFETVTIGGFYVCYDGDASDKKPMLLENNVMISDPSRAVNDNWEYIDTNRAAVTYFEKAKEAGATRVVYLIPSEPGTLQGPAYEIGEVIAGYKAGTWNFDNAEEDFEKQFP